MNEDQIIQELTDQQKQLEKIIVEAQKRLNSAPEGAVRVVRHGKGVQFFHRLKSTDKSGVYLSVSERRTALALVQKEYDRKIIAAARNQSALIDRFLKSYDRNILRNIYDSYPETRKSLIIPAELPDHEYAAAWQAQEFQHKSFPEGFPEHYTARGERVRSKSEVMIADALDRAGIPYRYECPLYLDSCTIHPDFTILRIRDRKEIYWEHLGMMDDPEYCANALQRIRLYEVNDINCGIDIIYTMEIGKMPINLSVIRHVIDTYCSL